MPRAPRAARWRRWGSWWAAPCWRASQTSHIMRWGMRGSAYAWCPLRPTCCSSRSFRTARVRAQGQRALCTLWRCLVRGVACSPPAAVCAHLLMPALRTMLARRHVPEHAAAVQQSVGPAPDGRLDAAGHARAARGRRLPAPVGPFVCSLPLRLLLPGLPPQPLHLQARARGCCCGGWGCRSRSFGLECRRATVASRDRMRLPRYSPTPGLKQLRRPAPHPPPAGARSSTRRWPPT